MARASASSGVCLYLKLSNVPGGAFAAALDDFAAAGAVALGSFLTGAATGAVGAAKGAGPGPAVTGDFLVLESHLCKLVQYNTKKHRLPTINLAGGLANGFDGESSTKRVSACGDAARGGAFVATFFAGGATGGGGFGAPPDLHLTVAFSNASLTLTFRTSAIPSIVALSGRSPTIFINVPKHVAASFRAPS